MFNSNPENVIISQTITYNKRIGVWKNEHGEGAEGIGTSGQPENTETDG